MKPPKVVTLDFETYGIESRPDYPPKPVGVAIQLPGKQPKYHAWGHPTKNNCTYEEGLKALQEAVGLGLPLLFHNAKFDIDVMETHCGIKVPAWDKLHDTLLLLFLHDPHAQELGLKPSAERLLGLPPEEQDAVADWLIRKQPIAGVRISRAPKSKAYYGKYIAYAPGDIVGTYAKGDVSRTTQLFKMLYPLVMERMEAAYDRERKLLPILLGMERRGVPLDTKRLEADTQEYTGHITTLDEWLKKKLKDPEINLDSSVQLGKALIKCGLVDKKKLERTPKGEYSVNKDSLSGAVKDKKMLEALTYRAQLKTCLNTFMRPWLAQAKRSGGRMFTVWNQVRHHGGEGKNIGARTGRLSSTPNLQNPPKPSKAVPPLGLPPIPLVRSYIVPPKGCVFIDRDYNQQELRILAHYEDGAMLELYRSDSWYDVHTYAANELSNKLGRTVDRDKEAKPVGFGIIYGMGVSGLSTRLECAEDVARAIKEAYLQIFPGVRAMYADTKQRARNGEPITTWGGRVYYCEPAKVIDGKLRTFDYKLVNVLIQGSGADCTKEALVRYEEVRPASHVPMLLVHDQIVCAVPKRELVKGHKILQQAMESVEFSVPMLSEGKWSATNWGELKPYDKKGVMLYKKKEG